MFILGIILIIAGLGCAGFGFIQNNSLEAQINSLLSSGTANPGTMFIIIGAVLIVVGVVCCIASKKKQ